MVPVQPNQTILDLATGTGLVAIPVAKALENKGSVIGVDMSTGMLAQAQAKIRTEDIQNLELIESDVELIDFNNDSHDLFLFMRGFKLLNSTSVLLFKY